MRQRNQKTLIIVFLVKRKIFSPLFLDLSRRNRFLELLYYFLVFLYLQECPLFKNCNIHFLKQLVSELKIEILPPKCTLIADDYTSRDIYFIRRGVCLEMNKKGIKIKSVLIIMNFVSPKGFVVNGEW